MIARHTHESHSELDVLLVGPFPPPLGGISVHVERLAAAMHHAGFNVAVLNHFNSRRRHPLVVGSLRRNPLRYWLVLRSVSPRILHYHDANWLTFLATAAAVRRRRGQVAIVTVHGHNLDRYLDASRPRRVGVMRWAFDAFDVVIAVSSDVANVLRSSLPDREIVVLPAYLPPPPTAEVPALSETTRQFLEAGHPSLVVAAYRLTADDRGRTVYGLDFALTLFVALACDHPDLRLALFVAQPPSSRREKRRLGALRQLAADAAVSHRLHVTFGEPLIAAFAHDCLFLRPSSTDGDAVAVREALAAGIRVIASDVVQRPEGAESLPLRNEAWQAAVKSAMVGPSVRSRHIALDDPSVSLLATYRSLLS